jgi:hypothetical protein
MADPEAKVVVSARDATAAAFNSANTRLKQFQRTAMGMKSLLASFGVLFSGRFLLNWTKGAIEASEATGAYATRIKEAQGAIAGMKKASDDLAVSVGLQLTPAFQGLGKVLTGLNAAFFNADLTPFGKQIADIEEQIREMKKHGIDTGIGELLYSAKDQATIAKLNADLAAVKLLQEQALGVGMGGLKPANELFGDGLEEMTTDFGRLPKELRRDFDFAAASAMVLNSELQEISGSLTKMPDDLKKLSPEFNSFVASLELEPLQTEAQKVAESIGQNFKDAFASWMGGADMGFKELLKRMAAEMLTSALFKTLAGAFAGQTTGIGGFFSAFFGGARAEGGPVSAGKGYLVGENGPELFMPGRSGTIAANGSGGPAIVQNFYNQIGLPPQWAAQSAVAGRMAAQAAYSATQKRLRNER